jgi:hypothetical protein
MIRTADALRKKKPKTAPAGIATGEIMQPGENGASPEAMAIPLFTSTTELTKHFGVAVGMYFWTTQLFGCLFMLIFLINIGSIVHFSSDEYNPHAVSLPVTGSAVCNHTFWVDAYANHSVANMPAAERNASAAALIVPTLHHACYLSEAQFHAALAVVVVLLLSYAVFHWHFSRIMTKASEEVQTVGKYTICIADPPADAFEPLEWREYFEGCMEGAEGPDPNATSVAAVTVLLNNGDLLQMLAKWRSVAEIIKLMPNAEYRPGELSGWYRWLLNDMLGICEDKIYFLEQYRRLKLELKVAMQQKYQVCRVFVTFATEQGMRTALQRLKQGSLPSKLDIPLNLSEDAWFRGVDILELNQADEPETIHYHSIGLVSGDQQVMQKLVMVLLLLVFLVFEFNFVLYVEKSSPMLAGLVITGMNMVMPELLHLASDLFEVHETEGEKMASVYNKISLFRYFNTVIIIHLITDWAVQLDEENILKVQTILMCDAFVTPLLYHYNIAYLLNRFLISRFISNEYAMERALSGYDIRLSDRYSNLAKCIFCGLFYLPVLPTGALLACMHCTLCSLVDRWGLLRSWRPLTPTDGGFLFKILAAHVGFAIITHLFMGMRFYASWTYDSACAIDPSASFSSVRGSPEASFYVCDKQPRDLLVYVQPWMSPAQLQLVLLYKYTFASIVGAILLCILLGSKRAIKSLFVPNLSFVGKMQDTPWAEVPGISAYIPQYKLPLLNHQLLACDTTTFDESHITWQTDLYHDHGNLFLDAAPIVAELELTHQIFSTCTQYTPDATPNHKAATTNPYSKQEYERSKVGRATEPESSGNEPVAETEAETPKGVGEEVGEEVDEGVGEGVGEEVDEGVGEEVDEGVGEEGGVGGPDSSTDDPAAVLVMLRSKEAEKRGEKGELELAVDTLEATKIMV